MEKAKELFREKNTKDLKSMIDEDKFISFLRGDTERYYGNCLGYDCIYGNEHESNSENNCVIKLLYKLNKTDLYYYIQKINKKANKNMQHCELIKLLDSSLTSKYATL